MQQNEIDQCLTMEAFGEWLASQDADAVVGEAGRPTCCPMANYLFVKTGGVRTVYVLEDDEMLNFGATLDEPAIYMPAPIWVQSFAGRLDALTPEDLGNGKYEVTASQALAVLFAVRINQCLNLESFAQWLAGQNGDAIVGEVDSASNCAIANYLRYQLNSNKPVFVQEDEGVVYFPMSLTQPIAQSAIAPDWVGAFLHYFESQDDRGVTASQALEAFNAVRSGLGLE